MTPGHDDNERNLERARGKRNMILGLTLILLSMVVQFWGRRAHDGNGPVRGVAILGSFAVAAVGISKVRRGMKERAPTLSELRSRDPRPPVLYLRPFESDATSGFANDFRYGDVSGVFTLTHEQEISRVVRCLGPLVAIGNPNEELPELGAARSYHANEEWQEAVRAHLTESQLVILGAGTSPGVQWELREVTRLVDPSRFLIFFPPRKQRNVYQLITFRHTSDPDSLYKAFRQIANASLPVPLPEQQGETIFIRFDENWSPYPVKSNVTFLESLATCRMLSHTQRALHQALISQGSIKPRISHKIYRGFLHLVGTGVIIGILFVVFLIIVFIGMTFFEAK